MEKDICITMTKLEKAKSICRTYGVRFFCDPVKGGFSLKLNEYDSRVHPDTLAQCRAVISRMADVVNETPTRRAVWQGEMTLTGETTRRYIFNEKHFLKGKEADCG